jgi:hypothetical protein
MGEHEVAVDIEKAVARRWTKPPRFSVRHSKSSARKENNMCLSKAYIEKDGHKQFLMTDIASVQIDGL